MQFNRNEFIQHFSRDRLTQLDDSFDLMKRVDREFYRLNLDSYRESFRSKEKISDKPMINGLITV